MITHLLDEVFLEPILSGLLGVGYFEVFLSMNTPTHHMFDKMPLRVNKLCLLIFFWIKWHE